MKNSDIHNHLSKKEVRDFLGKQLVHCYRNGAMTDTAWLESKIKEYQSSLDLAYQYNAILKLIAGQVWQEWDVSENVPYDSESYFCFIGTAEEYEDLLKRIEAEDENSN